MRFDNYSVISLSPWSNEPQLPSSLRDYHAPRYLRWRCISLNEDLRSRSLSLYVYAAFRNDVDKIISKHAVYLRNFYIQPEWILLFSILFCLNVRIAGQIFEANFLENKKLETPWKSFTLCFLNRYFLLLRILFPLLW